MFKQHYGLGAYDSSLNLESIGKPTEEGGGWIADLTNICSFVFLTGLLTEGLALEYIMLQIEV